LGEKGTSAPQSVKVATERFREDSDAFGDFLREKTINGSDAYITKNELYKLYKEYCLDQEIRDIYRHSKRAVGKQLIDRGYDEDKIHSGHIWRGLRERRVTDET
jgi:putative DNA primase/helicase